MNKPHKAKTEVVDVPADNPVGTMSRFEAGLRKVLASRKPTKARKRHRRQPLR